MRTAAAAILPAIALSACDSTTECQFPAVSTGAEVQLLTSPEVAVNDAQATLTGPVTDTLNCVPYPWGGTCFWSGTTPQTPGTYTLQVSAPGYQAVTAQLELTIVSGCGRTAANVQPWSVSLIATDGGADYGTGGQSGSGGQGGTGGSPGDGGLSTCADLQNAYEDALNAERTCTVGSSTDCQQLVSSSLSPCFTNCKTYVNDATTLNAIELKWEQAGCGNVAVACPAIACLVVHTNGMCIATDGGPGFCSSGSIQLDAAAP